MDVAELRELLSPAGLRLLDEVPQLTSQHDVVRAVSTLRKAGHSPGLVAAVLAQARLRERAGAKFGPFAQRMLFTDAGLQQASRLNVAAQHAGRFARAGIGWVADLGCGIGGDAMAIAALDVEVTAVERDEATAAIAAYNLAPWANASVEHADATSADLTGIGAVFLDPARRDGARRLADPGDWSPSLDFAFGLADRLPVGVKLGPGIDRDLIPEHAEAQWISVDREVVELGVWTGPLAREGVRRSALVLGAHGAAELTAAADSPDAEPGTLGRYLFEPDGAVIRARLIGDLARALHGRMLDATIAWITADELVSTPFAQAFEVVAELPLDRRALKRELRSRGIGTLEIKKLGVDVDPAQFRAGLELRGDAAATLVLTRIAGRRRAILVERIT